MNYLKSRLLDYRISLRLRAATLLVDQKYLDPESLTYAINELRISWANFKISVIDAWFFPKTHAQTSSDRARKE